MAKDDDDKELVIVGDADADEAGESVVVDEEAAKAKAKAEDHGDDERLAAEEDDDDAAATEAIRAQRRIERKAKKLREREARARTELELNYWRTRGGELEKRFSQLEQRNRMDREGQIDSQIAQIEANIAEAERLIEQGVNASNGATVREATQAKDKLLEARRNYIDNKERLRYEAQQQELAERQQAAEAPAAPRVDPDIVAHASSWRAKNTWYRPDKANKESKVASEIDGLLSDEGFDPATPEFWSELDSRLKHAIPHVYRGQPNGNGSSNGSGNGNGNGRERERERSAPDLANARREHSLKPGQVYISAERKAAMQAAGVWDDTKLRNRFLKSYANWDAEASQEQ